MKNIGEHQVNVLTPQPEETTAQVERVLASAPFQSADLTRKLLLFLAGWSNTHPDQPVKEIEVAVSVFDRSLDQFDPKLDSTVRVHIGRLRAKLLDYYANYGSEDPVVLQIPKGAYYLVSAYRNGLAHGPAHEPELATVAPSVPVLSARPWGRYSGWLFAVGGLIAGVLLMAAWTRIQQPGPGRAMRQFWSAFTDEQVPVLLAFSNPRLAGYLAQEGLHYYQDGVDSQTPGMLNLTYAGAGDVPATHALTQLFDRMGRSFQVRSGALLRWEEASDCNVIFVGRPEQNPALQEIPRLREFYFKFAVGIVNAHPRPGEPAKFSVGGRPYQHDYAVIARVPGAQQGRHSLILAGTVTYGTQAAAMFITHEPDVRSLLDRLEVKPGEPMPDFEALIEVQIRNEIPVWWKLVAARRRAGGNTSWEKPAPDER